MPSRSARKPRRERPRWKIVMALKARTSASGPPSAASCASSWSEATNQRRNSRPIASGGWPLTWTPAMRALLTWMTPIRSPRATRVPSGSRRARRLPVEPVHRAIGPVVEQDGPAVPGVNPRPRARDTQTCHPPTPWRRGRPCGPDSLRLSAGIVSLPACLCTSVSPRTRKRHARVGRELQLDVHLRSGSAVRPPAIGHQAGRVPPTLGEAPIHQHLDFGVPRERGLEIPRELWLVAGDENQMSGHRVFRCTSIELTRAACDLTPLDEQTPQALLQWELVPITDEQRRGLDNHEHRDHDSPKGGPRAHFPSQVKADASDCA